MLTLLFSMLLTGSSQATDLPPVLREFRGVWVASVDNIDWPTKKTLTTEQQKAEMIRLLDQAVSLHLNAIIFQVRPAADALYDSPLEPWSEYLTGRQGKPPEPYYDPLAFAVAEAHKRGLELHAWLNPYRAHHPSAKGPLASTHIANTDPAVVKQYGSMLWMDPGEPVVQDRTLQVIADIVKRYDVDGIHIDDYFYPYPEGSRSFPDDRSFASRGGGFDRGDWRRNNVNVFVERAYQEIHSIKPWVQFGISPFGIYRPGVPSGIAAGIDQYAELYSDPLKWLQNGWCDYISPQLYWPIKQTPQSFTKLLTWWGSENSQGRHVWPGLYTSRTLFTGKGKYPASEVVNQVKATRRIESAPGEVHFSMEAFRKDGGGISEALVGSVYDQVALPPASPWLGPDVPGRPTVGFSGGVVHWSSGPGVKPFWYVVWLRYGTKWLTRIQPEDAGRLQPETSLPLGKLNEVAVRAVSKTGIESEPSFCSVN